MMTRVRLRLGSQRRIIYKYKSKLASQRAFSAHSMNLKIGMQVDGVVAAIYGTLAKAELVRNDLDVSLGQVMVQYITDDESGDR